MNTVTIEAIEPGMTIATIPSHAGGMRTRIVGVVESVDRFTIADQAFASIRLTSGTTVTNMSGEYELVSRPIKMVPAGWTALALYGDQTVNEVFNRYRDEYVSSRSTEGYHARPWLPIELRELAILVGAR